MDGDIHFLQVTLDDAKDDSGVLGDVWLSPTIKVFKSSQQVAQLVDPSHAEMEQVLREKLGHHCEEN